MYGKEPPSFCPVQGGVAIHEQLVPLAGEYVVVKHFPNSFYETDLLEIIKKEGIQQLVVGGMMSHMCIDTTVRAAKDHGIPVVLLEDSCTTKDLSFNGEVVPAETVHRSFMAALNGMFAKVIKTSEWNY